MAGYSKQETKKYESMRFFSLTKFPIPQPVFMPVAALEDLSIEARMLDLVLFCSY
jgi:hypothetical protein